MTKRAIIFATLLLSPQCSTAQVTPAIGWDSLKAIISYPEILLRSGIEGAAHVVAYIDSLGSVDSSRIYTNREEFKHSIEQAISSTKWYPERFAEKPARTVVSFNLHFYINGKRIPKRIILEVPAAQMSVDPFPPPKKIK